MNRGKSAICLGSIILFGISFAGCTKKAVQTQSVIQNTEITQEWRRPLLPIPSCLPDCKESDKDLLTKSSVIEAKIVAEIERASKTVEFSMFTFSRRPIFEALLKAAARGVRVRGVMDMKQFKTTASLCTPTGCTFSNGVMISEEFAKADLSTRQALLKNEESFKKGTLTDQLVHLFYKSPSESAVKMPPGKRRLVHNKFVLADSSRLLTGSGNWSSTAISLNLENLLAFDASVETDKPVTSSYQCAFEAMWTADGNTMAGALKKCQNNDLGIFFSPSANSTKEGIAAAIVQSIDEAKKSIKISMHHLVYDPVFDALLRAKQRNIAIQVIVDDDDCNLADSENLKTLQAAGVPFRYVPTSCKLFQLAHNKYGIIDDSYVINGSGNWSAAGLKDNYENYLFYRDEKVAFFVEHFAKEWAIAQERSACTCNQAEKSCQERYCLQNLTEE